MTPAAVTPFGQLVPSTLEMAIDAGLAGNLLRSSGFLGGVNFATYNNNGNKTKHGKHRSQNRGFSDEMIEDIQQNYSQKVYQSGGRTVYAKKNGNYYDVVIVNKDGQVITTVGGNTKSLRNWSDVTKMLNNNGGYSSLPVD